MVCHTATWFVPCNTTPWLPRRTLIISSFVHWLHVSHAQACAWLAQLCWASTTVVTIHAGGTKDRDCDERMVTEKSCVLYWMARVPEYLIFDVMALLLATQLPKTAMALQEVLDRHSSPRLLRFSKNQAFDALGAKQLLHRNPFNLFILQVRATLNP